MGLKVGIFSVAVLLFSSYAFSEVPVRGFGNVTFSFTNQAGQSSTFGNGAFDIFLTKNIDDKTSFLAETAIEGSDDNVIGIDLERIIIQRFVDPWLKISAGRFHTALGYYNETYHHGAYLGLAVERPLMYHFEDDQGVLPVHSVGIEVKGEGNVGPGTFGYIANFANGRGPTADPPQIKTDHNFGKAVDLLLYYRLPMGLRLGANAYFDALPGRDEGNNVTIAKGREQIYGAHVIYNGEKFEFFNEMAYVKHTYDQNENGPGTGEPNANILAYYSQFGYHLTEKVTPYLRHDATLFDGNDAYLGVADSTRDYIAGVKWDWSQNSALKVEVDYVTVTNNPDATIGLVDWSFAY